MRAIMKLKKPFLLAIITVMLSLACQTLSKPSLPTSSNESNVSPTETLEAIEENSASQWLRFIGTERTDNLLSATTDYQGNVFIVSQNVSEENAKHFGFTKFITIGGSKVDPDQSIVLTKVNPNGNIEWEHVLDLGLSLPYQIAVDNSGSIYISGLSMESWGNPIKPYHHTYSAVAWKEFVYNGFVAKLDQNGKLQWNTFIENYEIVDQLLVVTSPNDGIYVAGSAIKDGFLQFLTHLSSDGTQEWATEFAKNGYGNNIGHMEIDNNENIYLSGIGYATWGNPINEFNNSEDETPPFIAKFDKTGNLLWNTFTNPDGIKEIIDIKVSSDGQIYLSGTSNPGFTYSTFDAIGMGLIAKFNPDGEVVWKKEIDLCIGEYTSSIGKNIINIDRKGEITFLTYKQDGYYATQINPDSQVLQEVKLDIPLDTVLINGIENQSSQNNLFVFGEVYNDDTYDNFPWANFEELNKPFGSMDDYLAWVLFKP